MTSPKQVKNDHEQQVKIKIRVSGALFLSRSLFLRFLSWQIVCFSFPCALLRIGCTVLLLITSPLFSFCSVTSQPHCRMYRFPCSKTGHTIQRKNIDSPDLPAVICFFICILPFLWSSSIFTRSSVLKILCRLRSEHFLHDLIILFFLEAIPGSESEIPVSSFLPFCFGSRGSAAPRSATFVFGARTL